MTWVPRLTEVVAYAWTIVCVRHAWKRGGWPLIVLLISAGIYGFVLEYGSVKANIAYCYDPAMIMLPPWRVAVPPGDPCPTGPAVPLWISCGWLMTIYVAMATTDKLRLPFAVRPLADGLLGMSIDWILDPLAAHVPFWQWYVPGPYYGIPLDNFFGWFTTIASFSFVLRVLLRKWPPQTGKLALYGVPALAIALAVAAVTVFVKGFVALSAYVSPWLLLGVGLGIPLVIVSVYRVRVRGTEPIDPVILGEVSFYVLYYAALVWITGLYAQSPSLLLITAGVVLVAILGYGWPYSLRRPPPARTTAG